MSIMDDVRVLLLMHCVTGFASDDMVACEIGATDESREVDQEAELSSRQETQEAGTAHGTPPRADGTSPNGTEPLSGPLKRPGG